MVCFANYSIRTYLWNQISHLVMKLRLFADLRWSIFRNELSHFRVNYIWDYANVVLNCLLLCKCIARTNVKYGDHLVQGFLPFPTRSDMSYSGEGQFRNTAAFREQNKFKQAMMHKQPMNVCFAGKSLSNINLCRIHKSFTTGIGYITVKLVFSLSWGDLSSCCAYMTVGWVNFRQKVFFFRVH